MNQDKTLQHFFELLKSGLWGKPIDASLFACKVNWQVIYAMAERQAVVGLCFDGIESLPKQCLPEMDLLMDWLGQVSYLEEKNNIQFDCANRLSCLYKESGIRTLALKGLSIAKYYRKPKHRYSCDLDCFLLFEDGSLAYNKGNEIIASKGIEVDLSHYKHSHFNYEQLAVENHQFCTGVRGKGWLKRLEAYLQKELRKQKTELIEGTHLECPSLLFTMLFFIQHAHNHFLHEGIQVKHLIDWAYLLKASEDDYTLNSEFKSVCKEFGLLDFADSMSRLVYNYLGESACYYSGDYTLQKQDEMLLQDMFYERPVLDSSNGWQFRKQIIKNELSSIWKYKYYSKQNIITALAQQIYGYLFDKNPEI